MGWECRLRYIFGSITLSGSENDPRSGVHNTWQAILLRIDTPPGLFVAGWVRSRLWMIQSCAVDFVGLDVFDLAVEGFGTEDSKPVGGLVGGVHVLLVLPHRHSEHLVVLFVGQEQATRVTFLHPQGRDEVLFYLMVSVLEALGANVEPGYPGEHGSTTFLLEGWTITLCRTFRTFVGDGGQVRKRRQAIGVSSGSRVSFEPSRGDILSQS